MKALSTIAALIITGSLFAQNTNKPPRLVVGIVVDQMRQEYLYRFAPKFSEGGFKRMMNQGFMLRNAHYNYIPTVTGPGHASVYTGTTPSVHGIVSNEWYDKTPKKSVNCVEDKRFSPVGSATGKGTAAPTRMLSTTVTDELKLFTQRRAKVVGVSIKDRGAILPAGHLPDGAYWYDGSTGSFISSSYYKPGLPYWVEQFNQLKLPDNYLSREWRTLLPIETYTESGPDDSKSESRLRGKERPVFPYNLPELRKTNENYDLVSLTPFGDDLLTEFAKAAMDGEDLGKDETPDFLTISYSTPDLIGHAMGPNSVEVEDTFVRLDRNIQDLFQTLDKKVGPGNYVIFLTSDHGVGNIAQELIEAKIPSGYFDVDQMDKGLNEFLKSYYPADNVIENISNNQIFLNPAAFPNEPKAGGLDFMVARELVVRWLKTFNGVNEVYTKEQLSSASGANLYQELLARGVHQKISGDVVFTMNPGWSWLQGARANHGSGYTYDTNVPILFYGKGVRHGVSYQYHRITDIAPTVSLLLDISFPNGCTGQPIEELFEKN